MGVNELQEFATKISPFFDPEFWNSDFEMRKETRRRQLHVNFDDIDAIDYGLMDEEDPNLLSVLNSHSSMADRAKRKQSTVEEDVKREQTVANHARTMTKKKLRQFAQKDMFIDRISDVFEPQHNKRWIKAICGDDKENVLHMIADRGSKRNRKSTMAQWENFDTENAGKSTGNERIALVPQLVFFSKAFFQSPEAHYIFRLVRQGIETLVISEETKVKMVCYVVVLEAMIFA